MIIREPKSIPINLLININEIIENYIKLIVSRNESLTEYEIKIKKKRFKYYCS